MALNSPNAFANDSRCSACLNENDNATYTPMDPTNRQTANTKDSNLAQPDITAPSTSNATTYNQPSTSSKPIRTPNKLSFTSFGLNLKRAKSFNFKTKRSASTATITNNSKKQTNQAAASSGGGGGGGGLGPIVSSLSLSPKWPLRFTCTARKDKEKQYKDKESKQQSEGCCRCVCYRPLGNSNSSNGTEPPQSTSTTTTVNAESAPSPSGNPSISSTPSTSITDHPTLVNCRLVATTSTPHQQQPTATCSSYSALIGGATSGRAGHDAQPLISYNSGLVGDSSVVQLVSNAILLLEEERERNRTMAAMAMAAMNGVVTTGAGMGGIYGSTNGVGGHMADVWEPLFHIPSSIGPPQQSHLQQYSSHEDCDESARRQRAREIEQGVDPPANYRTLGSAATTAQQHQQSCATRRVQLLCSDGSSSSDQDNACSSRRLQIVCPSDLPVDSLRALFQDHVTLRSCPLDSSWTGCHTQVDFVHCLVPDLLSISRCTFYWGKMDRYEAERLLDEKPEGTFLLRDSAQEEFLFSVSFRKYGRSLHARIEQWNHKFSFDSHDPGVYTSDTVCGLIEHYKDPSSCMFFEPVLTWPLHRNFTFSLQHLARAAITSRLHYDDVNQLQLPKLLKGYLKEYHYRQKVRVERFDDCGPPTTDSGASVQWLVNTTSTPSH